MNRCDRGQSWYNKFCDEVKALTDERYRINKWLSQHEAYISARSALVEKQQDLSVKNTGNVREAMLEPFLTFSKYYSVSYGRALAVSMFFLSVLSELLATLCFLSYSVTNPVSNPVSNSVSNPVSNPSMLGNMWKRWKGSPKDGPNSVLPIRPKDNRGVSFDEKLPVNPLLSNDTKIITSNRSDIFSITDSQYEELTKIILLGIRPPTRHSLGKYHGLSAKMVKTLQSYWLRDGIIEEYKRGKLTSYRLKTDAAAG